MPHKLIFPVLSQALCPSTWYTAFLVSTDHSPGLANILATCPKLAHGAVVLKIRVTSGHPVALWRTHLFIAGLLAQLISGEVSTRSASSPSRGVTPVLETVPLPLCVSVQKQTENNPT